MNKVIIINGIARSGKDSFVELYTKYSPKSVINTSTVAKIKSIASDMGWDGTKNDKSRKFLSDLKDLWTNFNDGIFKYLVSYCDDSKKDDIIFIHCREPNEIKKFKDYFKEKCTTLLIIRNNIPIPNNHADQEVFNYEYDMIVDNDGTLEEYENKIKNIVMEDIL